MTQSSPTAPSRQSRGTLSATVAALRPKQWVKNLFVAGPLLFSRQAGDLSTDIRVGIAFVAFCLASSAAYVLNDLFDYESDRQHPVKRFRPIAAGELSKGAARLIAAVMTAGAIAAALPLGTTFAAILGAYIALNAAYSLGLKHVVIVDVMMIGGGFVLRVLGGAAAVSVAPSHWLVLCTILLSVFLAFTKRRSELTTLEDRAADHRKVLDSYSPGFLDQMISVVTATTLMCYILYSVDPLTVEHTAGGSHGLLLTVPFVMYGIFRYLYVVYHREQGDNPTLAVLQDKMLIVGIALWAMLCSAVIYWPQYFTGWFSQ